MRRSGLKPALFACALAATALAARAAAAEAPSVLPRCLAGADGEPRAVTKVLDGETLLLDDGREVRLSGALAPRRPLASRSEAAWPPEERAVAALGALVLGRSVSIVEDARSPDRYGRRLAHVLVEAEGRLRWVQGELLAQGHARAYALEGAARCVADMLALEQAARAARRGLWNNAAYAVRRSWRTRELTSLRSMFQIVEGRVSAVAERSGTVYLNFGTDWKSDFTAGIRLRRSAGERGAEAADWKGLAGKRVRVRGWIERRNGPFVAVAHPGTIERLDGGEPAREAPETMGGEVSPNEKRPATAPGALDL